MTKQTSPHSRRWWILALAGIAQLMVVLDVTVVNVALPSAQAALHFSNDQRQWIVTAYSLAFGSMLLLGGKLGDLFGRKRTLISGATGFALASALGIYGAIGGSGASIGLLLGGVLTQLLDWRFVMYVNVLFAALTVVGALALLRNEAAPAKTPRLDLAGTATVSAGLFAIVFGLSPAET